MPIKGYSDITRIPRIGKIHLGIKTSNTKGTQYPKPVDYFVVKPDDSTSEAAAKAFHSVYGEEPREITVAFPSNDPDQFFPQWLTSYRGGDGWHQRYCQGDGESAQRSDEKGGYVPIPCLYKECPLYQSGKCEELGRLQFFLPDVPGIGVWQIDTASYYSTVNLNGSIKMVRALTGGRIGMIPLKLRLVPKVVNPEGKPKTVYVMTLGIDDLRLTDFLANARALALGTPEVEPISQDEIPEDLFIKDNLVTDLDVQQTASSIPVDASRSQSTNPSDNPESVSSVPPAKAHEEDGDNVIGSVAETKIKKTEQGYVGRITVASVTDDLIEALTGDVTVLSVLKTVKDGDLVALKTRPSEQWTNKLEIVALELNPAM